MRLVEPRRQLRELEAIFCEFDDDHDGVISRAEFRKRLGELGVRGRVSCDVCVWGEGVLTERSPLDTARRDTAHQCQRHGTLTGWHGTLLYCSRFTSQCMRHGRRSI